MKKSWIAAAVSLTMVLPTLAACTKGDADDKDTERVLRIAATTDNGEEGEYFRQQFTEIFEYAHPNIKLEFVEVVDNSSMRYGSGFMTPEQQKEQQPNPVVKLKEVMQADNPPDIVMFNLGEMQDLLTDNLLQPLDPMITKDKFDTADIAPIVMDGLKSASPDGKLYALSPTFSSAALVYNKKIFDEAGAPYPEDNMTWDQIFDLARRVTNKDSAKRVYGFSFNSQSYMDFMNMISIYATPMGMSIFDKDLQKLTVDSDNWEKVWNTLIQLEKDKVIPSQNDYQDEVLQQSKQPSAEKPYAHDDFLSNRLAMSVMNFYDLSRIDNANKNAAKNNFTPVEYNAVTMPSHPDNPGVVGGVSLNGIMGINAKAGNPKDAWSFLKFINGEDYARAKAKNNYQLLSRKSYIKAKEGSDLNMNAFINVKPAPETMENMYSLYRIYPNIYSVYSVAQMEYMQALQGTKSIRDALKSWQTRGDSMLQQMRDNPNGPIDMGDGSTMGAARAW